MRNPCLLNLFTEGPWLSWGEPILPAAQDFVSSSDNLAHAISYVPVNLSPSLDTEILNIDTVDLETMIASFVYQELPKGQTLQ